jgi:A118 family predicted phage portal protein
MGIISMIRGWVHMLFGSKAKEIFEVENVITPEMEGMIKACSDIYAGKPDWVDPDEYIKTINFAKSICSEVARLTTLATGIKLDGSSRAKWLQERIDKEYFNIRNWVEFACAYGTVVLKPSIQGIDLILPGKFMVTDQQDGEITGMVFIEQKEQDKDYYTRLEYHRFVDELYAVSNRCYKGKNSNDLDKAVPIDATPWNGMLEDAFIQNIDKPLYGVLRTPQANNIDPYSAMGMPIFAEAIEELKDLDIAYSRNAKEIKDSKRILLLDGDRMLPTGTPIKEQMHTFNQNRIQMGLPDMVKNVFGDGVNTFYQEINPTLQTETRIMGINALLSQIGYKCGFSNGYFVFNESSGIQTATGVEAEQQRTIQFIKDVRDKLEVCLDGVIYALNVFADLYNLAPYGPYEAVYDFGDITYNREEDRARWYGYASQNKVPFWYYLVKFEGMTEEEAKAMVEEAQPKQPTLFGMEE